MGHSAPFFLNGIANRHRKVPKSSKTQPRV